VAENLAKTAGYTKVKTDWYASYHIVKETAQEITTAEAAEMVTDALRVFERAGVISNLKVEPLSAEKIAALTAAETAQDATDDSNSTDDQASTENGTEAAKTAEEWAAESERVQAATLAALAPVIATEEAKETQENTEPEYLDERWPESNEAAGIWYRLEYENSAPTYYNTVSDFRTGVHQANHNGRIITAAWRHDDNTNTRRAIIPETSQEKTDRENREHCKRIAEELEAYADGRVYKCPDCGECITDDVLFCDCGRQVDLLDDDWEQQSLYDYFSDCLDVEYRVGSDKEYRSVCVMVTCGGPNIYIDTESKAVELYWWGDRASYHILSDAVDAVDDWAREYWECL
jgi:hypothetical protein